MPFVMFFTGKCRLYSCQLVFNIINLSADQDDLPLAFRQLAEKFYFNVPVNFTHYVLYVLHISRNINKLKPVAGLYLVIVLGVCEVKRQQPEVDKVGLVYAGKGFRSEEHT